MFLMQYLLSTSSWVGYLVTTLGLNLVLCLIHLEEEVVEGEGGGWGEERNKRIIDILVLLV